MSFDARCGVIIACDMLSDVCCLSIVLRLLLLLCFCVLCVVWRGLLCVDCVLLCCCMVGVGEYVICVVGDGCAQ